MKRKLYFVRIKGINVFPCLHITEDNDMSFSWIKWCVWFMS